MCRAGAAFRRERANSRDHSRDPFTAYQSAIRLWQVLVRVSNVETESRGLVERPPAIRVDYDEVEHRNSKKLAGGDQPTMNS